MSPKAVLSILHVSGGSTPCLRARRRDARCLPVPGPSLPRRPRGSSRLRRPSVVRPDRSHPSLQRCPRSWAFFLRVPPSQDQPHSDAKEPLCTRTLGPLVRRWSVSVAQSGRPSVQVVLPEPGNFCRLPPGRTSTVEGRLYDSGCRVHAYRTMCQIGAQPHPPATNSDPRTLTCVDSHTLEGLGRLYLRVFEPPTSVVLRQGLSSPGVGAGFWSRPGTAQPSVACRPPLTATAFVISDSGRRAV